MDRIRDASDSASIFNLHDPLFEKTLPPASHDECLALSLQKVTIRFDLGLDVVFPQFQIGIFDLLHGCLERRSGGSVLQYRRLFAH